MEKIIIAVDGFSSCGKSTMAKMLAKELKYIYIDSGAMYRAVTLYSIQHGFFKNDTLDEQALKDSLDDIKIDFKLNSQAGQPDTYLNGVNVEKEIRQMEVSDKVSTVSTLKSVREKMVYLQQEMSKSKGVVMDGRDIGTVVFPDAELKVFVTATPQIRAERRLLELRTKGDNTTTFEEVLDNINKRDYIDQHRAESPLKQADDAFVLDNTHMTKEEQMQWLLNKYNTVIHGKNRNR